MDADDHRLALVHRFFSGTGRSYDSMVYFATLGIDRRWKRHLAEQIPADAKRVLDLACGTGISTLAVANRLPGATVVGVELRDEYLQLARRKLDELDVRNVELVLSRAEDYTAAEPFDCIVASYLPKYADIALLVSRARELLRPGGLLLMHDFTYPPRAHLAAVWHLYFGTMQLASHVLFRSWREIFYGLPRLIKETQWQQELTQSLGAHGFQDLQQQYLTLYGSAVISARKDENSVMSVRRESAGT